jgi:hypothetical protein
MAQAVWNETGQGVAVRAGLPGRQVNPQDIRLVSAGSLLYKCTERITHES